MSNREGQTTVRTQPVARYHQLNTGCVRCCLQAVAETGILYIVHANTDCSAFQTIVRDHAEFVYT